VLLARFGEADERPGAQPHVVRHPVTLEAEHPVHTGQRFGVEIEVVAVGIEAGEAEPRDRLDPAHGESLALAVPVSVVLGCRSQPR
jgi:hypothetical protein